VTRRAIDRLEAERILVNGGEVWRGQLRYQIAMNDPFSPDKIRQHFNGSSVSISWLEFSVMSNFEVVE
jgi:hypothetical protein